MDLTSVPEGSALAALLDSAHPSESALSTLGYHFLAYDAATGEAHCRFEANSSMGNLTGALQGGFVAAMLDATVSSALLATMEPGQLAPTLDLRVSYLRPSPLGSLTAQGRVVHRGSSVAFLAGELMDADEQVLATATATVRILGGSR